MSEHDRVSTFVCGGDIAVEFDITANHFPKYDLNFEPIISNH
jgi:hypothetical protein